MKQPIIFIRLFLGFCLLASVACNQIEPESRIDEGQAVDTGGQSNAFSIFEIVSIDLGSGDFTNGELEGTTLERVKIPLAIQDNMLSFMVPKLNPGPYKLVFVDKGKPFNISFEVKTPTLSASPSSYLVSLTEQSNENILGLEKTKDLLVGEKKSLLENDLSTLKKQNEEMLAKAALLKESELADLAYFMEANQDWLDEIKAALADFGSVLPNGRIKQNHVRINIEERANQLMKKFPVAVSTVVKHIPKIVGFGVAGFYAGSFIPLIGNSVGAAIGAGWAIGNLVLDIKELFAEIDANAEFVQIVADQIMDSRYKVDYVFENENEYELLVSRNYRTLFKGDETSAIPEVKSYLGSFKQLLNEWAKVKSKLPFNLGYEPTNPVTVSTSTSKSFLVHSNHLSISDISNAKVTNTVKKEGGRLLVNFKTTEVTDQVFQFKINYDNAINGKLSHVNDATLTFPFSNYKLEIGDYQPNYSNIKTVTTLSRGDNFSTPNYVTRMVRLTLDGNPVKVGGNGLSWTMLQFGQIPTSSTDVVIPNYEVTVYDYTNSKTVTIPLNVTLTNAAYSRIVGKTITVKYYLGGPIPGTQTISFKSDGTYLKYNPDGSSADSAGYSFVNSISPNYVVCPTYIINKEIAGAIYLPAESQNVAIPKYFIIYSDNTISANSNSGCSDGLWRYEIF